jgi:sugar phosphate isomerase/epimerase
MLTGLSTYLFLNEPLTVERLQLIRSTGFDRTEIFALKPHFDYSDASLKKSLTSWLQDQGSFLHSIHTPFSRDYQALCNGEGLSIGHLERGERQKAIDEIQRCLDFFENVSFPYAIVHMGAPGDPYSLRHLDALYHSLEILIPFSTSRKITLLLENIPNQLSTLERMVRFMEEAHFEGIGFCLDLGHSFLQADPVAEIQLGAKRLRSTHLHDNNGRQDDHLFPFEGNLPWKQILGTLIESGYQGCHLLELRSRGQDPLMELIQAAQTMDRLRQLQEEILSEKN